MSTNDKGHTCVTCFQYGGTGKPLQSDKPEAEIEMGTDEYEAQRLGTVIFLIGAGLAALEIGVRLGIADKWACLPPWYYLVATAVITFVTWSYHSAVANLDCIAIALTYFAITFPSKFVF